MGKKDELLGMPFGTAMNKLRKALLFRMAQQLNLDQCYRCGNKINFVNDLSIEHKDSWQQADDPIKSFFDLDNIAFSHLRCNSVAGGREGGQHFFTGHIPWNTGKRTPHGTFTRYNSHGCRCEQCKQANTIEKREQRNKVGPDIGESNAL